MPHLLLISVCFFHLSFGVIYVNGNKTSVFHYRRKVNLLTERETEMRKLPKLKQNEISKMEDLNIRSGKPKLSEMFCFMAVSALTHGYKHHWTHYGVICNCLVLFTELVALYRMANQ